MKVVNEIFKRSCDATKRAKELDREDGRYYHLVSTNLEGFVVIRGRRRKMRV